MTSTSAFCVNSLISSEENGGLVRSAVDTTQSIDSKCGLLIPKSSAESMAAPQSMNMHSSSTGNMYPSTAEQNTYAANAWYYPSTEQNYASMAAVTGMHEEYDSNPYGFIGSQKNYDASLMTSNQNFYPFSARQSYDRYHANGYSTTNGSGLHHVDFHHNNYKYNTLAQRQRYSGYTYENTTSPYSTTSPTSASTACRLQQNSKTSSVNNVTTSPTSTGSGSHSPAKSDVSAAATPHTTNANNNNISTTTKKKKVPTATLR